jgi:hypothetical protein
MAKVLLHIGAPKTASTTLQNLFFYPLHQKGIINYLGQKEYFTVNHANKKESWHYKTYQKIRTDLLWGENFSQNSKKYKKQIDLCLDKKKINIISDEVLFNKDQIRKLIAFPERVARMQFLLQGHSVRVFCVLRRQPEYLLARYTQNYSNGWYYVKNNNSFEKYYQNIISEPEKRKEILHYIDSIKGYKDAFGKVHCLFFEELLENEFSYYQKIASLASIKIKKKDIPRKKLNVKPKNKEGYITYPSWDRGRLVLNRTLPIFYHKLYSKIFFIRACNLIIRSLNFLFLRYNILLSPLQKKNSYQKLIKFFNKLLSTFDKPTLHPYLNEQKQQTILKLCKKTNQELAKEGFLRSQDLKKYGYL